MSNIALRDLCVERQKHNKRFGSHEVLKSLFKNDIDTIRNIPYDLLMGDVRKKLVDSIYTCFYPDTKRYRIRSTNRTIRLRAYLEFFTMNLFECALTLSKYSEKGEYPMPLLLFHGTTTRLLKNIMKEGLTTSTAGTCWKEDSEKKVFLTDSLYIAEFYARNATLVHGGTPVILTFRSQNLNVQLKAGPERFQRKHSTIFD